MLGWLGKRGKEGGGTYDGDDLGLDERGEREELQVEGEVELGRGQRGACVRTGEGGGYGGDQEAEGDGLLGLRHCGLRRRCCAGASGGLVLSR